MKKNIFLFFITVFQLSVSAQNVPATLTPYGKTFYKCLNGPAFLIGYDATSIYVHGSCYDKKEDVAFDASTFDYIGPVSHPENSNSYQAFVYPEYTDSNPHSPSLLRNKLEGSKFTGEWTILCRTENIPGGKGEYLGIEFGYQLSKWYIFGVAITKYDSSGKIIWSNVYARTLFIGSYGIESAAPLIVQKNEFIYVFYVDRELNYNNEYFNHVYFGDSFDAMKLKNDLICRRINASTGESEKFLIRRQPASKGMFFLNQALELEDGSFALLGYAKGFHSYMWYNLKISE